MNKRLFVVILTSFWMYIGVFGQSYQSLWKQVEEAQEKDLPKTAVARLQQIIAKAGKEKAYGQLLKSELLCLRLQGEVSNDSLAPAIKRLEAREQAADDMALKAVYDAVLSRLYGDNSQVDDSWERRRDDYRQRAMARPDVLAQVKADGYEPFVIREADSELYGHDLLSVIGAELNAWDWLSSYYERTGNRPAACLTALEHCKRVALKVEEHLATSPAVRSLDSLLTVYGDLPEACEIAIERYRYMSAYTDATSAQKYDWLQQSLHRWGHWKRANVLRNDLQALTNPTFQAEVDERVGEVGRSQVVRLRQLRNVQQLTMRIFRTTLKGDTQLHPDQDEDYKQLAAGLTELKDHVCTVSFAPHAVHEVFDDSLTLAALPAGVYLLEFSTQPSTAVSRTLYFVSGVRLLMQALPDSRLRYVVVDATTGQPVPRAMLRLSFGRSKQAATTRLLTCNGQGEAVFSYAQQRPTSVMVYTDADNYCPELTSYGQYNYFERKNQTDRVNLFTDRSIYRPGQTVHVAAIVWREVSAVETAAVADKSLTFELRDANYKLVAEQQAVTDRFGKCAAVFTLPQGQLNGRFSIRTKGGSTSFRVEAYRRPTFQVAFDDYKEAYQGGDVVKATAKAQTYAGVPVQGAKVKYTVRRRVAFWWMGYSRYWQQGILADLLAETVVGEGETVTADDGTFQVDMPLVMPQGLGRRPMFYHFVVEADVTDMAGETHSGTLSLPLGSRPSVLTSDLPQQVRADQLPQVTFTRRNAAGQELAGTVHYRLDGGKWKQGAANAPCALFPTAVKSGEHRLEAVCEQDTVDVTFVVFGLDDKKPATKTNDWFYVSHGQFPADGSPVTLQVGASDPDLYMVYGIFAGNRLLESGAVKKNGQLVNRQFTYQEDYGNGLLVTYAWVKDGQCYRHETFIRRPMPDKQLRMTWETFRDRLTPGQQEEWRLRVTNPDGTPADASLMAVLYDKSLDALSPHHWSFTPVASLSKPSSSWLWRTWGNTYNSGSKDYRLLPVPDLAFSRFDDSVFPVYYHMVRFRGHGMTDGVALMSASATPLAKNMMQYEAAAEVDAVRADMSVADDENPDAPAGAQEVQVRENLNETAFCYPALQTDADGAVTLKFTLPESLTTWRLLGIAHTPDMFYGAVEAEAVARKDVMVQPHIPRFIRMGDQAQLSTRLFNTADHAVSGTVRMLLTDPERGVTVAEQQQPFAVEQGKTGTVTFVVDAASLPVSRSSLLVCKFLAVGDGFSDGEQHYLPILPDYEQVTRTVPYTQHEPGVKTIDLTRLFPQGSLSATPSSPAAPKLTVEYTNNPVWLMVQSLPTLGQPLEHSAIDQAASYYSNLLAKTLLQQNPQVKGGFEQWKREEQQGAQTTLAAQLEKNQELKDLLLAETPWVGAADREDEQKQRLADFFDENTIDHRLSSAVEKLQQLQQPDGSFSWYRGMQGSTEITVAVQEMLSRLTAMTGEQAGTRQLQDKAFRYLGGAMVDLVAKMRKAEQQGRRQTFPSFTALRWLYLCAIDGRQLPASVQLANDYLVKLLKKDIKRQSIYEKAMTAVVLAQRGETKKAAEYVRSLKEYTVYTEEMGRYYDTRRATYSWYDYKIPTEVAAIEAIRRVTPQDRQTVDEMRRWLLQEKRTQQWDTPINTVNAIWAFLYDNSQSLTATGETTVLAIDGRPIDLPKATAGVGYVKTAIDHPQGQSFTATKTSEGTSWGAVYAQFFQKTSDIGASQSGISVKREVSAANSQFSILNSQFKVGDRIKVRITIEASRDLDFVQVVDRRAACMEPVNQLSGYHQGAYVSPKDYATHYFYGGLAKGKHVIETEYYIDRAGDYETGTCSVGCAYAPEYRATAPSVVLKVNQ